MDRALVRLALRRFLVILIISAAALFAVSEITFRMQPYNIDRAPKTIEIVIPAGTADKVAAGETIPAIPQSMVFVLGDVLVVRNEDNVLHELGPHLVPPGASASVPMDMAENFSYSCSFSGSSYLGLDVKEATTWKTKVLALAFSAPATAVVIFLYSLAVKPLVEEPEIEENPGEEA